MVTFNENLPPLPPCIYIYKKFKYSKLPLSQTRRDSQGLKYCGVGQVMRGSYKMGRCEGLQSVGTGGGRWLGPPTSVRSL